MDHNEAVRLQAAEKYALGELSQVVREEYEEHYFDCAECALDLKTVAAFVDTSREVWRQEAEKSLEKDAVPARGGWFGWLRPAFAVPVFAALLFVVTYQNTVTIPKAKEEAAHGAGQLFISTFSLQMANVRGGDGVKVQVHKNEGFALAFDFTPTRLFDNYICQLQDEAGRSLIEVSIPGSNVNKEAHLVVPGGLVQPGKYHLAFTGAPGLRGQPDKDEVSRLSFSVEILP